MSLPNAVASGAQVYEIENAQFNTMLCKEKMNFARWRKKWRATAGAVPATMPGPFMGEGAGQNGNHCTTTLWLVNNKGNGFPFSEQNLSSSLSHGVT
jgi:hypothetical protein